MKKIMFFAAFAAALTLSSCMKENPSADAPSGTHTVHFTALSPDTKTVFGQDIGEGYPVLWQNTDEIGIVINKTAAKTSASVEPSSDSKSASFSATWTEQTETPASFTLVSPNVSLKTWSSANQFMVEIPSSQTSTAAGPDPSAQILYALKENVTDFSNVVDVTFSHLTAYLHIIFKDADLNGGNVQTINITCSGNGNDGLIAGRFNYNYDGGFDGSGSSRFNTISVTTNTLNNVWCAIRPIDFSGKTLSFTIVTDKGTLSRDVTMPPSSSLAAGHIAKFTVNMSTATSGDLVYYDLVTNKDDLHWGDKVIVATALQDYPFAIGKGQNTNNRSGVGVTFAGNSIANPTGIVEIFKIENGSLYGKYALRATVNKGYLYAANVTDKNSLKTQNSIDLAATWDISFGSVSYSETSYSTCAIIQSQTTETNRNLLRFNPNDCLFTVYSNTNWVPVRLYRKRQLTPDPIEINDILFHEQYWTGSSNNQKLTQYQASGNASTVVYGGAEIVYSQDESSTFLNWPDNGNVFLPSPYEGPLSTTGMGMNLRIQKNGGWMKAAGIPCNGVKKATLTYKLNRNGAEYTASSDTEGITIGDLTRTSGTSEWGKGYTEYSYPLTFAEGLTTFNFKITDSHASNHIYIADIKVVVTEVY